MTPRSYNVFYFVKNFSYTTFVKSHLYLM